jgi:23S rRNA (cytidine1920-2'-O)/16S rRNA (cytidine1409-2'-O)-methyltransferase
MPAPGPKGRRRLIDVLAAAYPQRDREWLYARILHGDVKVNGHREKDSKRLVAAGAGIELLAADAGEAAAAPTLQRPYVSRGGDKLAPVLASARDAGFRYEGQVILDAGASTGGFTDCLLRSGARLVHAVDVGYNQLDYRLRSDPRVMVRERCNIMSLEPGDLDPAPAYAVADLSFRSMEGAAAKLLSLLRGPAGGPGLLLGLIKPQFELEYTGLTPEGFDGVLDDPVLIGRVLDHTRTRLAAQGVEVLGSWPAGIAGTSGNQEVFWLMGPITR